MKNFTKLSLSALLASIVLAIWFYRNRSQTPPNQAKKVLVTMVEANIQGFDPARATDSYAVRQIAKVYEGLFEYHYLKRPFELVPNLAAAMPTVSADGRVYTIKLQPGVKFQDNPCFAGGKGRELVAEDFVYSIKRVADPRVQSSWFSMLAGKIQGLDAWRNKYMGSGQADYTAAIEGLKALDKYTLQITLNKPWPQLSYILAMRFCYAVPREAVEHYGPEFLNHPVGTGPFTLQEFNPQLNKLVYYKNPTFRDKYFPSEAAEEYQHLLADAGKKLPLVDKVITHILPEEQPRWLKFQQGAVDVADISRNSIALEVMQDGRLAPYLQQKGVQLFQAPEQSVGYIAFNHSLPLFKNNPKLRQALALAFDREKYEELFHKGIAVLAQSIVPPGLAGHAKGYVNPYNTYNLARAKQLLAEAGYPSGKGLPVITLDVGADIKVRQEAEFFQKCMEKLGVKIKVVPNIFPELLKKKAQKKTMMHSLDWIGDYPDAENFLWLLYKSDQISGIGVYFSDPDYNALYEKAMVMQPSPARTALYEQLYQLAAEKVPVIYKMHRLQSVLYHGWVKNLCWSDFYASEQYIDIDLEAKKRLQAKF
ncbi:MAG: ABC transporter substrate-binding protein [Bacteroidota bacterium]